MSYKNFETSSPLVACYNSTSQSTTGVFDKIMSIDSSLFSGEISGGDTITLDYKAALMGDIYGQTNNSLGFWSSFHLNGTRQYQGLDVCSGISTASFKAPEQFFTNSDVNDQIESEWRVHPLAGSGTSIYITAGYPRLTGILLK